MYGLEIVLNDETISADDSNATNTEKKFIINFKRLQLALSKKTHQAII